MLSSYKSLFIIVHSFTKFLYINQPWYYYENLYIRLVERKNRSEQHSLEDKVSQVANGLVLSSATFQLSSLMMTFEGVSSSMTCTAVLINHGELVSS